MTNFIYEDEWGLKVFTDITPEKEKLIVDTILKLFANIGFSGESIVQSDRVYEMAPEVLAELAEKLNFEFEIS